jgi:hypothetical protein
MEMKMTPGTRVEVALAPTVGSEMATVVRATKVSLPAPGPNWTLIKFDGGDKKWAHNSSLRAA